MQTHLPSEPNLTFPKPNIGHVKPHFPNESNCLLLVLDKYNCVISSHIDHENDSLYPSYFMIQWEMRLRKQHPNQKKNQSVVLELLSNEDLHGDSSFWVWTV